MGDIAAILKVATPSTANATSYASGSYTPAADRLLLAVVSASRGGSNNPDTPTLAGNGLAWDHVQDPVTLEDANNLFQSTSTLRDRLCVFFALTGATPSLGALTATFANACTGCNIIVVEIDLVDLEDPFVQMRMVAVGAAAATVSMDAFEDPDNAVVSCFAVDANATIVGEHPELADITYATPARETMAQFLDVADTSPSVTWTGANTAGGIAIELRQAGAGGTAHTEEIDDTVSLADQLVRTAEFERTIPDTVSVDDDAALARGLALADSLNLADDVVTATGKGVTIDDTVAIADALALGRGLLVADAAALTDQVALARSVAIADSVALADSVVLARGLGIADSLDVADQLAFARALLIADSLAVADNVNVGGAGSHSVQIDDAVALADALTRFRGVTLGDTVVVDDELELARSLLLADSLALSDLVTFARALALADGVSVSDAISTGGLPPQVLATAAVAIIRADARVRVVRAEAPATIVTLEGDAHA